ncbi:MAG: hypothetical protein LUC24_02260 [Bacteroidales bacterium]|nr:hypothetical protein [Bacteroidales bacterium]
MERYNELREMPFEALVGVVKDYPWFGAAQKILCEQMSRLGGRELSRRQFSDAALHVACRGKITDLLREEVSCTDQDIEELLKKYVQVGGGEAGKGGEEDAAGADDAETGGAEDEEAGATISVGASAAGVNSGFRGVGDYFSREQYEEAKRGGLNWNRRAPIDRSAEAPEDRFHTEDPGGPGTATEESMEGFYTETLAQIYEEQGYLDKAKEIYAKLILGCPEKSAYFAALIEKLNVRNKN